MKLDQTSSPAWDTRRAFLQRTGAGFGSLALNYFLTQHSEAQEKRPDFNGGLHHKAKVKRIIQLFMNGGVSQVDTYDYKPELNRLHGQKVGPKERPEGFTADVGAILKSPFTFKQYGQTGRWVSTVFPHQATLVDEFAFLMAMASKTNVHGQGSYMMNTGFILPGFPCMGAWISYAIGSLSDNLPTFIVLPDARGLPYNNRGNFTSGFLPAVHQGLVIEAGAAQPIPDLKPSSKYPFATQEADRDTLALLNDQNRKHAADRTGDSRLTARIAGYELAARMQLSAPEAFDLQRETKETHKAYGMDEKATEDFGRRCLLARRLVERGVRFVQVWSGPDGPTGNWDNHADILKELPPIATSVDKPIAALFRDLKSRGLLQDTLVVWTTEFGRTPFSQGSVGRDHNGGTFVTWLAGAGIHAGTSVGKSDDWGWQTADGKTYCYDLHATILHLLGIDHTKLTYRHNGVDRRLTDVHGHVIDAILS